MDNTLEISWIKQLLAIKSIELGVQQIREIDTDISTKNDNGAIMIMALNSVLPNIPVIELDSVYYYTSNANWTTMTNLLSDIAKTFPWEENRFDCDKRSTLIASMTALIFRLNTCMRVYCKITNTVTGASDFHYPNIYVDDSGVAWLWDLDQAGIIGKVTGQGMILGKWKYEFIKVETV